MKTRKIDKLIQRCIDYSLYMKELFFTKEEIKMLENWKKEIKGE